MKKSNMFKIEEMNLYKTTDRFLNNYKHLKKSLKRAPTLEEISDIDQLHYNGVEAVNEAILKTKIQPEDTGHIYTTISTLESRVEEVKKNIEETGETKW